MRKAFHVLMLKSGQIYLLLNGQILRCAVRCKHHKIFKVGVTIYQYYA